MIGASDGCWRGVCVGGWCDKVFAVVPVFACFSLSLFDPNHFVLVLHAGCLSCFLRKDPIYASITFGYNTAPLACPADVAWCYSRWWACSELWVLAEQEHSCGTRH